MNNSMFERLMTLPLFKGITRERIAQTVGTTPMNFQKYPAGERLITAGDQCTGLVFVISGSVRSTIASVDGRFAVSQTIDAPRVVSADFLFGMFTDYPCTVDTLTDTTILKIEKADYLRILQSDPIFMINYLNLLSMNAQKSVHGVLAVVSGNLEERLAYWICALSQPGTRDIVLTCRHRDLYSLFGMTRSAFFAALDNMTARGLITYTPTAIAITDRRDMVQLLTAPRE